ncbi:Glutamate synthase [NADPH] small chain [hydrothermal vent metagenome]|uniref:Glutamate synthase [NADPH] small chain n=1 Tax=hydrothermal vent metagenome TaxID=652676 RepID=A0A3B1D2X2_9ZZZZ
MGDPKGFLKISRSEPSRRSASERIQDWNEIYKPMPEEVLKQQGARCMDCGVPFCQGWSGCPVQNMIPEWNDLVARGRWKDALKALHSTNNFPEFTGRLCPAPCEGACVLGIIDEPVAIRVTEWNIIDRGFSEGWVAPIIPTQETGKKIAVIGSGPAGLAAAQQLRRNGHSVTVFEKDGRIGGLLRYGIPDFKMEKWVLERRLKQMTAEGVVFKTNVHVGENLSLETLKKDFDAICLTTGASVARDLNVPGRDLKGIHLAMDFLTQQNKRNAGDTIDSALAISAKDKRVVILGGGDTGADCLGTSHRQGAKEIHQIELLPEPPAQRSEDTPWPLWPMQLRTSAAHEEGGIREWSFMTKKFSGENDQVKKLHGVRVEKTTTDSGAIKFNEVPDSDFEIECDLVLLAMGFTGPQKKGLLSDLEIKTNERGNVIVDEHRMTNIEGVFAAGDIRLGASLIVWAIYEGREAAKGIEAYLSKSVRN